MSPEIDTIGNMELNVDMKNFIKRASLAEQFKQ